MQSIFLRLHSISNSLSVCLFLASVFLLIRQRIVIKTQVATITSIHAESSSSRIEISNNKYIREHDEEEKQIILSLKSNRAAVASFNRLIDSASSS